MTDNQLKIKAFDLIRHEVRDFERSTTDSELGNYIKGVVDLYTEILKEKQNKRSKDEILPMGKYPASISGCNMEEDKPKDERFICNTCRKKFGCTYYAAVKDFLEKDPNNDMKCERYIKE